jgi:hypothetical protein
MGKRDPNRDHPDSEMKRWKQKYRQFPGVAECARLIREGYARGAWTDIIVFELAENANDCLGDLTDAFHAEVGETDVRLFILMALEIAKLPESVPFLTAVLTDGNPRFTPYAIRGLKTIDTAESRKVLWDGGIH